MADGYNDARAMRITEIMTDFRNLQHYIAQVTVTPTAEEYNLEGYRLLRACQREAQQLLNEPFNTPAGGPAEESTELMVQLRRIINDASVRRFKAHRIYLRVTAAIRWINSRNGLLRGRRATYEQRSTLSAIDDVLRVEFASITDEQIYASLRAQDASHGKWLDEDPSLAAIQSML